uniref:DUF3285 domain-containing protein n=1 Tax=Oscillatoriales cyanobacterium SpSt-402 TaxID=2282168 RepID=A0A832M4Y3_9CYAN
MDTENVSSSEAAETAFTEGTSVEALSNEPKPSYVKLAMRNMVRKRGKSLQHFFLTTVGLLSILIGLSYLTR